MISRKKLLVRYRDVRHDAKCLQARQDRPRLKDFLALPPPATPNRATVTPRLTSADWLSGEHLEFPQRVSVRGGAGGAVHPDIPPAAGDGECLRAARSRSGGVDRGPG